MAHKPTGKTVAHLLTDLDADAIAKQPLAVRDSRFEMRLSKDEHKEMKAMAAKLGLTVSEYLLELHRHALKRLQEDS